MTKTPARSGVLVVHRYFWPDTPPYASLLRAIGGELTGRGHRVEVLTSQPSYKPETALVRRARTETVDDLTVRRIAMRPDRTSPLRRLFNLVWFPLAVATRILAGPRYAVVMCSTAPPVLLGAAASWAARRRGASFVYHCMDLHPEIGALSGDFANPLVYRLMMALDRATCRRADRVVVLSDDMRDALLRRDPALADKVVVLTNFELPDYEAATKATSPLPRDERRLRIVFTGNLGRFQALEVITRAVLSDDAPDDLELVFMGEGAAKAELTDLVASAPETRRDRVTFLPHGSPSDARALLRTADVGLVSLSPEVIRYAYPSKTATYLSEGLPVLVLVEPDSELARLVTDEGIGGVLPTDESGIRTVLAELVSSRGDLADRSVRARDVWQRTFAASALLPRWGELMDDLDRRVG